MTQSQKNSAMQNIVKTGNLEELPDELNPELLFSTTYTQLLVEIVAGRIDAKELANEQLRQRGLDPKTGKWVGYR